MVWAAEDALLVGFADGTCAELTLPTEPDTSESFELEYEGTPFDFSPIVEARREAARKAKVALKPAEPPAAESAADVANPLALPAEEEPVPEEEEPDLEPGAILALMPIKDSKVCRSPLWTRP